MKKEQKKKHRAQIFRAGVGAIILNENGKVLGLERKDIPAAWQLPQGGLEEGEAPLEAVKREIFEETGIEANQLELLATAPRWLAYELPEDSRSRKIGVGQVQRWFVFRFRGPDEAITLGDKKEFSAWKWTSMDELASKVVSFKRPVYRELAELFKSNFSVKAYPDELIWDVRAFVYRHFADTTRAPSVDETAARFALTHEVSASVYQALHDHHAFYLAPHTHDILMANPFSGIETPFRVHANGKIYFANCAWDSLGIPVALHSDAEVEAVCAQSDEALNLLVRNGEVSGTDALVHFLIPFKDWYDDLVHT